jgi:DNA repair exonuclease SbcCD nuclease subunit|tara:strand:- start:228 stop:584 length:357 start_codon:yes stop_codon:yes gene_type:complete
MDNFDAHKWFKKEYLGEGHTEDKMERDMEARKRSRLSPNELKKLDAMRAFYRGETDVLPADLKEDDIEENRLYPDYDDIIELIKSNSNKNNSSEIDEAMDVMEFIGQEYGINFEFGRG